jgi:hypothetical protein
MAMFIDPEAAAYGVFQIAFATMDSRLSRFLVAACRCKSVEFTFGILHTMPFGKRLEKLRKVVKFVERDLTGDDPGIRELKEACDLATRVQEWRNARIHAEVRFSENRPVLVDREGHSLQISREECEQKIREAIHAGIAMEAGIPHVVEFLRDLEALDASETDI